MSILEYGLGKVAAKKVETLSNIEKTKKENSNYRVIDFGGGKEKHYLNKFSFFDAIVDFREIKGYPNLQSITGSLEHESTYESLLKEVDENGKYDFSICTHTLEDLNNPLYVIDKIIKISKRGLVSVPSKYLELTRPEESSHRGYYHHRYIATINNQKLFFIPKTPIVERKVFDDISKKYNVNNGELWLIWENDFDYELYQDGWCGPSSQKFFENTYSLLLNGEEDSDVGEYHK